MLIVLMTTTDRPRTQIQRRQGNIPNTAAHLPRRPRAEPPVRRTRIPPLQRTQQLHHHPARKGPPRHRQAQEDWRCLAPARPPARRRLPVRPRDAARPSTPAPRGVCLLGSTPGESSGDFRRVAHDEGECPGDAGAHVLSAGLGDCEAARGCAEPVPPARGREGGGSVSGRGGALLPRLS